MVLNQVFFNKSKLSYNSKIYMTDIISNLEESKYWTKKYNCLLNITKKFNSRSFRLTSTRNVKNNLEKIIKELDKDNVENNYLTMIFNNKNFVDASSAISKKGYKLYRIAKNCDISKSDINILFSNLNETQKYFLFSNLVVSKKYCHLVLNNSVVLDDMSRQLNNFPIYIDIYLDTLG